MKAKKALKAAILSSGESGANPYNPLNSLVL